MKEDFLSLMSPSLRLYYKTNIQPIQQAINTTFPENLKEIQWLQQWLSDDELKADVDVTNAALYKPMRQYIKARGKLFRPFLTHLLLEAYGKKPAQYKAILTIPEIIHCSSLILDDIVDRSLLRRGESCSHILHGVPLAGNGSLAATFYGISLVNDISCNLKSEIQLKLYEMLYWEHYGCSIGTALDLGWSKLKLTEIENDSYIQHIVYRSCAYTYRVAARTGSIVGEASNEDEIALFNYSTLIGIAFQFIDDILNLVPGTSEWGKTIGEDITEGKRSPLILHTLKVADESTKIRLLQILDSKTTNPQTIEEAITILKTHHAFEEIRNRAKEYINKAREEIDTLKISDYHKKLLHDFAVYVLERNV